MIEALFGCDGNPTRQAKTVEAVAAGLLPAVPFDTHYRPRSDGLAVVQVPAAAPDHCAIVPLWGVDDAASGSSLVQMPAGGFVWEGRRSGKALSTLFG
jgi:hypothetical protein